jgi:hypothetical protein
LSKIATTINKLKSALLDINVTNTSLVKKNNSLIVELSFMPEGMREKIRGAPIKRENQRTDPHYLVPDGNKFVFQRANPSDPIVAELQTGSHYKSVDHLLREADASRHLPVFGSKNKGRKKESCLVLDKKTLMTKSNLWYQTSNLY